MEYNANHELTKSVTITQQGLDLTEITTTYHYDAFGRRISKQTQTKDKTRRINNSSANIIKFPVQHQKTQNKQVNYLWDGNRQLQEQTDTHIFTTIYEQDSFEPVARLVWLQDELLQSANDEIKKAERESWEDEPKLIPNVQIYHYHNDHLGTPNELTTHEGEVVWLADYEAWGNTAKIVWREEKLGQLQVSAEELQPIRFQGQSFDAETGLHYNRFRYFDPDLGMFVSRDPIGLMGGMNTFQYAPNPTGWVDPFGLASEGDARIISESIRVLKPSNGGTGPLRYHSLTPQKPKSSTHGNSLDCCEKTYGYILFDRDTDEVVKFGETIHGRARYSTNELNDMNATMRIVTSGSKIEMRTWETTRILEYTARHGRRPKYNFNNH